MSPKSRPPTGQVNANPNGKNALGSSGHPQLQVPSAIIVKEGPFPSGLARGEGSCSLVAWHFTWHSSAHPLQTQR